MTNVRKALGYAYAALEEMAAEHDDDIEIGGEPISPYAVMSIVKDAYDNLPRPPEPDWSQAPEWAQWWAVDASGIAGWYEQEPEIGGVRGWELGGGGAWMVIETPYDIPLGIDWRTLKQRRPEVQG